MVMKWKWVHQVHCNSFKQITMHLHPHPPLQLVYKYLWLALITPKITLQQKYEQKDHNNTMNNIWNVMRGLVGCYSNSTCTYKVQIQYQYVMVCALVGEISQIMPQINKNSKSYMISANIHYGNRINEDQRCLVIRFLDKPLYINVAYSYF
jgi:hypothetical protein